MRVTMYSQDYEPITVLSCREDDIHTLRQGAGNQFQAVHSGPVRYQALAADPMNVSSRVFSLMLLVEGMEWADRVTRPILVLRGARMNDLVDQGTDLTRWALDIFRTALSAAMDDRRYAQHRRMAEAGSMRANADLDREARDALLYAQLPSASVRQPRIYEQWGVPSSAGSMRAPDRNAGFIRASDLAAATVQGGRIQMRNPPGAGLVVGASLSLADIERAAAMLDAVAVPTPAQDLSPPRTIPRVRRNP